ncbi:MAG: carbohydrate ABC transporter permease [Clostridiales bacterium]|jgi:putative aldouronate transport system permease protein|nr:carbohydrate ABC transporter permease [Clostridiales bacterium]
MGKIKKTRGEWAFDIANLLIMLGLVVATLFPFLHIAAISFNEARDSVAGGIGIFPRKFSLDSYITVFRYNAIFGAFLVSAARTLAGTALALAFTSMAAYTMTKKQLVGYKYVYHFFVVSMFISGGIIPTFFLYQWLHIYNTFWVYVLPGVFSVYNMILMRTFILQLPGELEESALLDGASEVVIFLRIILPLSGPILATIGLFIAVGQWNSWQDTLFFTNDPRLETLQYVLMKVMRQAEAATITKQARVSMARLRTISITPESVKMAITIVSTVPILCVYPFIQKYFVKGMMIGAVKG